MFGPVLHVLRYRARGARCAASTQINATGYGLTFGLHTRIDETIAQAVDQHPGRQPLRQPQHDRRGGRRAAVRRRGLSGTGPKAGGPLYLHRLLASRPDDALSRTFRRLDGHGPADSELRDLWRAEQGQPLTQLQAWARQHEHAELAELTERFASASQSGLSRVLPGPTGERNSYLLLPRERVLCLTDSETDRLTQLAAVLAVGGRALWPDSEANRQLQASLPQPVQARIQRVADWTAPDVQFDALLHHGDADQLRTVCRQAAARPGPIIGVVGLHPGETALPLERLLIERSLSVNTAAAGGNASLMTID